MMRYFLPRLPCPRCGVQLDVLAYKRKVDALAGFEAMARIHFGLVHPRVVGVRFDVLSKKAVAGSVVSRSL